MSQRAAHYPEHSQDCRLTKRDRAVLRDLARVRLLTGRQLERLHFAELINGNARGSARRRSLGRLTRLGYVTTLPRRVGGERAGSAGLVYALDSRAHRDRRLWDAPDESSTRLAAGSTPEPRRPRRPWAIGWLFVSHTLDVAELYVQLREAERAGRIRLLRFDAEPASWFSPDAGDRQPLKPDAYAVLEQDGWERHWWIEVDRATESLPTLTRKLSRYLDAYQAGAPGPDEIWPRVLVTVPDDRRAEQVTQLLDHLCGDEPLMQVSRFDQALGVLASPTATPVQGPRPPP